MKNKKIIGFAAFSGTGKTTLIKKIVSILSKRFTVSVIKHAHHDFDLDHPGKDSYEIRKSGAENILISSEKRWALIHENKKNKELTLENLLDILENINSDIVLVEGFKKENFPKIELYRKEIGKVQSILSLIDLANLINKKPLTVTSRELMLNSRSRSAKLRIAELNIYEN